MTLQERVLEAVGGGIEAKALYARLSGESPAILDCALGALCRARRLELTGRTYRRPQLPPAPAPSPQRPASPRPQMKLTPKPLMHPRTECEIRADLVGQLEAMLSRWERRLAADRRV